VEVKEKLLRAGEQKEMRALIFWQANLLRDRFSNFSFRFSVSYGCGVE
jgi:hypothetical protein